MADEIRAQQKLLNAQIRAQDAEIELFLARLEELLKSSTRKIASLVKNTQSARDAILQLNDLEQVLIDAGLAKAVSRLRNAYAAELRTIQDSFQLTGVEKPSIFTSVDRDVVEALINNDLSRVGVAIKQTLGDVQAQLTSAVILQQPPAVNDILGQTTPTLLRQVRAEINTSMTSFNRTVTAKKAIDLYGDNPSFIYLGPIDKVTRPFCSGVLTGRTPAIYTLSEINGMKNDQIEPVITYGGGYNCRHVWRPVSKELAKEITEESEN